MTTGVSELLLRFPNGREELRVTDHLDRFTVAPGLLAIDGRRWRVTETAPASTHGVDVRLVCVPGNDGDRARIGARDRSAGPAVA